MNDGRLMAVATGYTLCQESIVIYCSRADMLNGSLDAYLVTTLTCNLSGLSSFLTTTQHR